jgi:hypothetical protein
MRQSPNDYAGAGRSPNSSPRDSRMGSDGENPTIWIRAWVDVGRHAFPNISGQGAKPKTRQTKSSQMSRWWRSVVKPVVENVGNEIALAPNRSLAYDSERQAMPSRYLSWEGRSRICHR